MSGKDKAEISGRKEVFKYIISEGSTVVLDVRDLVKNIDTNSIKGYSWKQTAGIPIANDVVKDMPSLSFPAPYVRGSEFNTELTFELTVKDNDGKKRGPYPANVIVKRIQRAMIFQAGVALGAYEAGAYHAIVKELISQDRKRGLEQRPLFDIVAGASIGAFNAAVVLSSAVKSRSWENSAQELVSFWRRQKYPFPTLAEFLDTILPYHMWWDVMHTINEVAKSSASTMIDSISNINPYLKGLYDMLTSYLPRPRFC